MSSESVGAGTNSGTVVSTVSTSNVSSCDGSHVEFFEFSEESNDVTFSDETWCLVNTANYKRRLKHRKRVQGTGDVTTRSTVGKARYNSRVQAIRNVSHTKNITFQTKSVSETEQIAKTCHPTILETSNQVTNGSLSRRQHLHVKEVASKLPPFLIAPPDKKSFRHCFNAANASNYVLRDPIHTNGKKYSRLKNEENESYQSFTDKISDATVNISPSKNFIKQLLLFCVTVIIFFWDVIKSFYAGFLDAVALNRCAKFFSKSKIVRKRSLNCVFLNGVIFLGSITLFKYILLPSLLLMFRLLFNTFSLCTMQKTVHPQLTDLLAITERGFSHFFRYCIIYPLYALSLILNAFWYRDIAGQAQQWILPTGESPNECLAAAPSSALTSHSVGSAPISIEANGMQYTSLSSNSLILSSENPVIEEEHSTYVDSANVSNPSILHKSQNLFSAKNEVSAEKQLTIPTPSIEETARAKCSSAVSTTLSPPNSQGRLPLSSMERTADAVIRILFTYVWLVQIEIMWLIPLIGAFLYWVHFTWLISYFAFEYRWQYASFTTADRLHHFEAHWLYYLGFGSPYAIIQWFCPQFIDSGVMALLFPICILSSFCAAPVSRVSSFSWFRKLPIFAPVRLALRWSLRWAERSFFPRGRSAISSSRPIWPCMASR